MTANVNHQTNWTSPGNSGHKLRLTYIDRWTLNRVVAEDHKSLASKIIKPLSQHLRDAGEKMYAVGFNKLQFTAEMPFIAGLCLTPFPIDAIPGTKSTKSANIRLICHDESSLTFLLDLDRFIFEERQKILSTHCVC